MARVTVEDCLENEQNRFALVLLVAKRAKQILKGSDPTVSKKNNKYVVNALREVAAGHVAFKSMGRDSRIVDIEKDLHR